MEVIERLTEGNMKSNIKKITQRRKLAAPPPPIKKPIKTPKQK